MKCGLVILNYIDYETTIKLLQAVKNCDALDHIAVVDNASPNDSYNELRKYQGGKVSVIQSGRNGGYAFGNNVGIKYLADNIGVDIVGIANPDVMFGNELVAEMKRLFREYPDYAAITGKLVDEEGRFIGGGRADKYTVRNRLKQTLLGFITPLIRYVRGTNTDNTLKRQIEAEMSRGGDIVQLWLVQGCLFFARVSDLRKIDFLDEHTFMYCEEQILATKLERLGKKSGISTTAEFRHMEFHHYSAAEGEERYKYDLIPRLKLRWYLMKSRIYYFNNYLSDNIFINIVANTLDFLRMFLACGVISLTAGVRLLQRTFSR